MENDRKKAIAFAIVGLAGLVFMGWLLYPTPKANHEMAQKIVAYNRAHPVSWLDAGLGAAIMFFTMMVAFIGISLREAKRFAKDIDAGGGKSGPEGSDGGGPQRPPEGGGGKMVRLPMSRKVIDISDWRKAPTDGHIHRGAVTSPA